MRRSALAAVGGVIALAVAVLAGLLLGDGRPPELLLLVGRFHPMIVHFPIALLVLAGALEIGSSLVRPLRPLRRATPTILIAGAASAIAAVIAGYLLSLDGEYDDALLDRHKWLGIGVALAASATAVLSLAQRRRHARTLRVGYRGSLALTVGVLMVAGHMGGSLTHGPEYLTEYLPAPVKLAVGMKGGAPFRIADIDSAVIYRDLVAPILDRRCTSCHGERKAKGELRLDSREGILAGGEDGSVIAAGNPDDSELYRRITLPPGHKHAMPPDGAPPLPVGDVELIRWWIADGASFDRRVADVKEVPTSVQTTFTRIAPLRAAARAGVYAIEVAPASAAAIASARRTGARVESIALDLPLLHVSTVNVRRSLGDAELRHLLPVAKQITWLDLAGTRVSDTGMNVVAEMRNLTRLDLANTAITDAGARRLSGLKRLEYLNLRGTRVRDGALATVEQLPSLRSLYLWETAVTDAAIDRLRAAKPTVRVVRAAPATAVAPKATRVANDPRKE